MTFYVYFRDKQEILRFIWDDIFERAVAHCVGSIADIDEPVGRFRAFCRANIAYWLDHPEEFKIVYLISDRLASEEDIFYVDTDGAYKGLILFSELIQDAIDSGHFVPTDVAVAGQSSYAMTLGLAHAFVTIPEYSWMQDQMIDFSVDSFVHAMAVDGRVDG